MEARDRPALERRYRAALGRGDAEGAAQLLGAFTRRLAREAGGLLDALAGRAARGLGLPGVPPDARLLQLLEQAAEAYAFEPTSDAAPAPWRAAARERRRARRSAAIKGGTGAALFAPREAAVQ